MLNGRPIRSSIRKGVPILVANAYDVLAGTVMVAGRVTRRDPRSSGFMKKLPHINQDWLGFFRHGSVELASPRRCW